MWCGYQKIDSLTEILRHGRAWSTPEEICMLVLTLHSAYLERKSAVENRQHSGELGKLERNHNILLLTTDTLKCSTWLSGLFPVIIEIQ